MAEKKLNSEPTSRLADRVMAAQRKYFVGRRSELELFRSSLLESDSSFAVLFIYGPGGIGKTTLLNEFARAAYELGVSTLLLDGRTLNPAPSEFLLSVRLGLGLEGETTPIEALAGYGRSVLLIDTYELLTPLDDWLRDSFLPELPESCLVVIAGRNPPASMWRTAPGWRDLVRIVSLRNLHPDESRTYLNRRGLPEPQHSPVLEFTHGHPLALALVADVVNQRETHFDPQSEPDVVRVLLEQFLQHVPSPLHREALEICAHTRVTTEALLAATMGAEEAPDLFKWLSGLSFIEQSREGLFPHDLARDVLDTNLRWRNPAVYRDLHYRVRGWLLERLYAARGLEQQSCFFDISYLHRNSSLVKNFYEWKTLGQSYVDVATLEDIPHILEMVRLYEGEESAFIAEYWLERQPQAFRAFRSLTGELIGFMAQLQLEAIAPADVEADPAMRAAAAFIQRHGPLRPGETIFYLRFSMGRKGYQVASSINNLVSMACAVYWLTHPELAWSFLVTANLEYWRTYMNYHNQHHAPEADFEVGKRRYYIFTHDWRAEPPDVWMNLMGERELATNLKPEMLEATETEPLIVLSQPEFEEAVRCALRDYTHPDLLMTNPLWRSRVLTDRAGMSPRPEALQALLSEAADSLNNNPKTAKLYHALHRTYFEPAPTQEAAAEILDLPFSTYRYHLTNGIRRIVDWLWQREVYGFHD